MKWVVELGEFDIKYISRSTIQAHALADFIIECSRKKKVLSEAEEELDT